MRGWDWAIEDLGLDAATSLDWSAAPTSSSSREAARAASDWAPGGAESSMSGTPAATMRATNSSGSMDSELALMVSMKDAAEYCARTLQLNSALQTRWSDLAHGCDVFADFQPASLHGHCDEGSL